MQKKKTSQRTYIVQHSKQLIKYHMIIIMGFYTTSHGKFHDSGYSDILYGINSIDNTGYLYSRRQRNPNHMIIIMFYYLYWKNVHSDAIKVISIYIPPTAR